VRKWNELRQIIISQSVHSKGDEVKAFERVLYFMDGLDEKYFKPAKQKETK
jgi:hypothetical protein